MRPVQALGTPRAHSIMALLLGQTERALPFCGKDDQATYAGQPAYSANEASTRRRSWYATSQMADRLSLYFALCVR